MKDILEVLTIRPKQSGITTVLSGQTRIGNKWFALTKNFLILTLDELRSPEYVGEEKLDIQFNGSGKKTYRLAFYPNRKYEIPKNGTNEQKKRVELEALENERKQKAATEFFALHMQIKPEGQENPYLTSEDFLMEFQNQKSINNSLDNDQKFLAYTKIKKMNKQERYNVALYYKPDLVVSRHSEVMVQLADYNTGILMNGPLRDDFLNDYDNNPLVTIQTYVNKAVQLGILRDDKDLGIFHGSSFIGANPKEAALVYMQTERDTYDNIIVKEVNQKIEMPEDDLVQGSTTVSERLSVKTESDEITGAEKTVYAAKMDRMYKEADSFGIKNFKNMSEKKLTEAIEKAENLLANNPKLAAVDSQAPGEFELK